MHSLETLNDSCHCISVDEGALRRALESDSHDLYDAIRENQPHLFSSVPVFVSRAHIDAMQTAIEALGRVIATDAFVATALEEAPSIARHDPKAHSVFFGFDFHMGPDGPKLIEINTNAGGAFLNLALARAHKACCDEVRALVLPIEQREADFVAMFEREHSLLRPGVPLRRVAIVDDDPQRQYLYPEFVLAAALLRRHGIAAEIADPSELTFDGQTLSLRGAPVDLVYNRSTDFYFTSEKSAAMREAYLKDSAVITPHPRAHALFANKANLVRLSDAQWLKTLPIDDVTRDAVLAVVPKTVRVHRADKEALWAARKQLFFKPMHGFGSKAAYRGDKLTKATFEMILDGEYVAQDLVPPSTRTIKVGEEERPLKLDLRAYVYEGAVQLFAARLYQGQTTNFRTEGGGFAPVFTR